MESRVAVFVSAIWSSQFKVWGTATLDKGASISLAFLSWGRPTIYCLETSHEGREYDLCFHVSLGKGKALRIGDLDSGLRG